MRVLSEETKNAIAEYNIEYQKRHGISPSFRNIMHALNLNSLATVQRYVKQLEAEGLIERTNIGNIAPLPKLWGGETVTVPLIGQIACGEPCLEVENIEESFSLPCSIFGNSEMFMLRASGESMIDVANKLKDLKAGRIFLYSTFGLFTNGMEKFDKAYEEGLFDRLLTTNLVYQRPELLQRPYYISCDMSKYIALLIDTLNHDASISELLDPYDRIHRFLTKYENGEV